MVNNVTVSRLISSISKRSLAGITHISPLELLVENYPRMHLQKYSGGGLGISSTVTVHSVICFCIVNSDGLIAIKQSACISADPSMGFVETIDSLPPDVCISCPRLQPFSLVVCCGHFSVIFKVRWPSQSWTHEESRNQISFLSFRQVCLNLKVCFFLTLQVFYRDLSTINSMRTTRKVLCRTTSYKWFTIQKNLYQIGNWIRQKSLTHKKTGSNQRQF